MLAVINQARSTGTVFAEINYVSAQSRRSPTRSLKCQTQTFVEWGWNTGLDRYSRHAHQGRYRSYRHKGRTKPTKSLPTTTTTTIYYLHQWREIIKVTMLMAKVLNGAMAVMVDYDTLGLHSTLVIIPIIYSKHACAQGLHQTDRQWSRINELS